MEHYGILLVDDEPAYHGIISALLTPLGCLVNYVTTVGDALEAVGRERFDLILMDIELGGAMDGYAATALLRSSVEWLRTCAIVAFTTLAPDDADGHFRRHGFDGYIQKPFTAAGIAVMASRWLGCAAALPEGEGGRLAALLGEDEAARMIDRLHVSLAEAVDAIDGGAAPGRYGHRLGGLAGTLGFPVLSASWLSLQGDDSTSWPTVRALTCEALARR